MREAVIRTENLVHTYKTGKVTALKGVNVEIYEGDIVSIVGQNGSGKTTLVRHFNGLLRPSSGKVFLFGEDTEKKNVGDMSRQCGYVFQNPNHQIFCTTVREELLVGPGNFKFSEAESKAALEEVVDLMGLGALLDKHPMTLDYTTKKIVTIASVLVFRPKILILDEPTGGLDEVGRRLLGKLIKLMHETGHTVVMISHDMDYVAENSERMIVMTDGQIQSDDVPAKVFVNAPVLKLAQIEPPQISQLDMIISGGGESVTLSVEEFVRKYKAK